MTETTAGLRGAVGRFRLAARHLRDGKLKGLEAAAQLIKQPSRLWRLVESHSRTVLAICLAIALAVFWKAELSLLAHGKPDWSSWFDQGHYLMSTFALAAGDLNPAKHRYPIGYALMAAPFTYVFPRDPFVIVDMLSLAGSLWAFMRLGELLGIARAIGGTIFLATSVFTYSILLHYVIAWTSTPTTYLILTGLMLGFLPPTYWRALLLGLIPGLIVLVKPADAVPLVPLAVYYAIVCLRAPPPGATARRTHTLRLFGMGFIGLAAGAAVATLGHWLVNGWTLSAYERSETHGGAFILGSVPFKLYSLFVDPSVIYGHYLGTEGIFSRYPWMFIGALGMILMVFRDLRLAVLAICAAVYVAMYGAYFGILPNNLWYYNIIHYFTWCFPVFGLFAFVLVRRLLLQRSLADAVIVILASVLLLAWRPVLQPVAATVSFEGETAASIQIADGDVPFAIDLDGRPGD